MTFYQLEDLALVVKVRSVPWIDLNEEAFVVYDDNGIYVVDWFSYVVYPSASWLIDTSTRTPGGA